MTFVPQTWVDGPAGHTPITAGRLTHIETGLSEVADKVDATALRIPFASVSDPQFHAVGDGVADDHAAIAAAMDLMHAQGGGMVYVSGKYGWKGDLVVPNGVMLAGMKGGNHESAVSALVALDSSSRLKVGDWTSGPHPAGLRDLEIDGNHKGYAAGGVWLECVQARFDNLLIHDFIGPGLYLNASQNCAFVSVDCQLNGTGIVLDNGAGGNVFLRSEVSTNQVGILFDDNQSMGNAYPFGSAHNEFIHCIIECYADCEVLVRALAGANNRFVGCGFSNNDIHLSSDHLIEIDNPYYAVIGTQMHIDSCNFNGGAEKNILMHVNGYNSLHVSGQIYVQQTSAIFVAKDGLPLILPDCMFTYGQNVEGKAGVEGAGGLSNIFVQREWPISIQLPGEITGAAFSIKQLADAGTRFFITSTGSVVWADGATYAGQVGLDYEAGAGLVHLGRASFRGGVTRECQAATYPTGDIVIDANLRSVFKYVLSGTGTISSMTVIDAVDGAVITIMIATEGAQTAAWAANMRFNGGVPPDVSTVPSGDWLSVTFMYDDITARWIEQYRSLVPAT